MKLKLRNFAGVHRMLGETRTHFLDCQTKGRRVPTEPSSLWSCCFIFRFCFSMPKELLVGFWPWWPGNWAKLKQIFVCLLKSANRLGQSCSVFQDLHHSKIDLTQNKFDKKVILTWCVCIYPKGRAELQVCLRENLDFIWNNKKFICFNCWKIQENTRS